MEVPLTGGPTDAAAGSAPSRASAERCCWHGHLAEPDWEDPTCVADSGEEARPGYYSCTAAEYLDKPSTLRKKVAKVAELLRASKKSCVYTGAGISTASGVPDYASKASKSVAPHMANSVPKKAMGSGSRLDATPTYSHHALAALGQKDLLHHWIQQNHDRLGQKAGFPQEKTNEIHGAWGDNKNQVKMMDDGLRSDLMTWLLQWEESVEVCMALGTSLCGMNADRVAAAAGQRSGLVIVNLQQTSFDSKAAVRIWGLLDDVLRLLAAELRMKVPSTVCQSRGEQWTSKHPGLKYNTPVRKNGDPL